MGLGAITPSLMFNVGAGEIVLILVVALIILGPQRLPELARGLGKFMREFRRQTDDVRGTLEREFYRMDQEMAREEPPRRAEAPAPPMPAPSFPLPALPPAPLEPLPPDAATAAVEQPSAPEPAAPEHTMAGLTPAALDPSLARTQALQPLTPEEAAAALDPQQQPPPALTLDPSDPEALPRVAPVPGTVPRNALKRSPPPSPEDH